MLKDLLRKLKLLGRGKPPIDPATFNDPLALTIQWTPASKGGSNFRTHKLVEVDFSRVEFKASANAKFLYSILLFLGIGVAVGFSIHSISSEQLSLQAMIPVLAGTLFVFIGGLRLYFGTTPIIFDKQSGYFWKGRKSPQELYLSLIHI